jgi:hypothetical protein
MVARLEPPTSVIVLNEISSSFRFDHALRTLRNCAISQYSVLGRLRPYIIVFDPLSITLPDRLESN